VLISLTKRINHSEAYSDGDACTNQAESFFSRICRAEIGIHHHVAGSDLSAYAKAKWEGAKSIVASAMANNI
jgi:hypothetical protein